MDGQLSSNSVFVLAALLVCRQQLTLLPMTIMLTVQAGLVPRIFAYLFARIQQVQSKQVHGSTATSA